MAEKKFNGRVFRTEPVLARKLLTVQARFFRMVGPAIARLPEIMQGNNNAAIAAFSDIFASTEPEELADMIATILEMSQIQRPSGSWDQVDIDGDFTQNSGDIIPVAVWVAQEQFGDFFSGLQGVGGPKIRASA